MIPVIASAYCGKYPVPFFLGHPVFDQVNHKFVAQSPVTNYIIVVSTSSLTVYSSNSCIPVIFLLVLLYL